MISHWKLLLNHEQYLLAAFIICTIRKTMAEEKQGLFEAANFYGFAADNKQYNSWYRNNFSIKNNYFELE